MPTWGLSFKCESPPLLAQSVKLLQRGDFSFDIDGHVILHRIQGSENQVEDADRVPKLLRQLLDHNGKAACSACVSHITLALVGILNWWTRAPHAVRELAGQERARPFTNSPVLSPKPLGALWT